MSFSIPYDIDLLFLIVIPFVVLVLVYMRLSFRYRGSLKKFETLIISLLLSSLISILYFGLDYYILKNTDIVAHCGDFCGLENAMFALLAGGVAFVSLLVLIVVNVVKRNKKHNSAEQPNALSHGDMIAIRSISAILFIELVVSLFYSDIGSIVRHEDFLGVIIELVRGPLIENAHLFLMLSLMFFVKRSIPMTKIILYLSIIFLILNYYTLLGYYILRLGLFSMIKIVLLLPKILLLYFVHEQTKVI